MTATMTYGTSVSITLTPPGTFPPIWTAFALCIDEDDDRSARVRVGLHGKPQILDVRDEGQLKTFCESLLERAVMCGSEALED
jgi:hypothetical protein